MVAVRRTQVRRGSVWDLIRALWVTDPPDRSRTPSESILSPAATQESRALTGLGFFPAWVRPEWPPMTQSPHFQALKPNSFYSGYE